MPQTALSILSRACQIARTPNYVQQAIAELNTLSQHIADTVDLSAARGQWNFFFSTQQVSSGGGNIIQTAGAPLPIDYLRVPTSGGVTGAQRSSKWYYQGVPYDMVEIDLTEFDDQVQQAGLNSYPYFWAKDLARYAPVIEVVGDLDAASTTVTGLLPIDAGSDLASILPGLSIAGGIGPRSVIQPGATVTGFTAGPPASLTISAPPAATLAQASLLIGYPGVGLMYPPPSGAYAAMIRYQRRMPRLTLAQVQRGSYCWFADDKALVDGLAGLMMKYSDDSRMAEFIGGGLGTNEGLFGRDMGQYIRLADDNANRGQSVMLDRRMFGKAFSALKNTKKVGW